MIGFDKVSRNPVTYVKHGQDKQTEDPDLKRQKRIDELEYI